MKNYLPKNKFPLGDGASMNITYIKSVSYRLFVSNNLLNYSDFKNIREACDFQSGNGTSLDTNFM